MGYSNVHRQRAMALDQTRNEAYFQALQNVITPESVVLDLGAGLGVHGLMAAKLGAKHVYCVEPQDLIEVAKKIARANSLAERMTFLQGRIEEVVLPEKVDVIVSVFTGNFLLEEDLLPSLFHARDRYLKADGQLIPDRARMEAVPVNAPEWHERELDSWSDSHHGVDFGVGRPFSANMIHYGRDKVLKKATHLALPRPLMSMDLCQATDTHCRAEQQFEVTEAGMCHGWVGWFQMRLGDTWLSTAPHAPEVHWSPAFLPLDPPLALAVGDIMTLKVNRPPFGDWTWTTVTKGGMQRHSTFLGRAFSPRLLRQLAVTYQPELSAQGQAIAYILSQFDGQTAVDMIVEGVLARYPALGWSRERVGDLVSGLVVQYGGKSVA